MSSTFQKVIIHPINFQEREKIILIYAKKWPTTKTLQQLTDKLFLDFGIQTTELEIENILKK